MVILGLDNGYHFTKTSEGVMFSSTVRKGKDIDINADTIQTNIDGQDYVVGAPNGEYVADSNKIDSIVTEICTFTAIAKSFPENKLIDCNIVAGLPVSYYSKQKSDFKEKLLGYGNKKVKLNKHNFQINIVGAEIYPQSAGVVFVNSKDVKSDDSLVVDIGGGTVDVSAFHGLRLTNMATYNLGMLVLYSKLAQKLNSEYECKFMDYELYDKLKKGYITSNKFGRIDLEILNDDIEEHTNVILNNIKRDFNYNSMDNIFVIGGGGVELYDRIKQKFKNAILCDDAQFVNANAFELMGQMKFATK
ncbi:ParM/StbA family protein [Clostridium kluyveri]|uniref:Uncharacterized protein n=2 Tax=Clostridium kluyveri TaxID=1534 RepID=A5F9M1_CLOK5|nr:ParM/StbA family protein [Clostridium kluyveri]ABQ23643.1 conserved hypothetical protein [Clostridium kluyveri DSM 555]BAH08531.1 hypothetical protein CKR_P12 [Clostridium kluyveri NBRC 12016]